MSYTKSVNDSCFECDNSENLHNHHVVPRVLGGTRTIRLCELCHGKVHERDFTSHKTLQKMGIRKAKNSGIKFGRPKALSLQNESDFTGDLIFNGFSTKELAVKYNISEPTARRRKREILNA
jgi:hypothetical protein